MVFAVVGIINTLIDVNVFAIAYGIFGIPLIPANLLAWFFAVSFSYAANAMTTFGPESGQALTTRDYIRFEIRYLRGCGGTYSDDGFGHRIKIFSGHHRKADFHLRRVCRKLSSFEFMCFVRSERKLIEIDPV